ncbi:hypothetical protein IFM89_012553 [Coptis chinensis]|uniref:F-box associated beta-propeller type 3 domain-containing protein n=1 Tax=Coptis chinensis TaxID=261450 RepID=A0A835HM02_9MAGN|nr:hypothetical protein IFM89_012553 [Coptis chinensis]
MWNPITQDQVTVATPLTSHICAFFFHPKSREYTILFYCKGSVGFKFFLLSLATKSSRQITSYSHPPLCSANPIILYGALHWIVDEYPYECMHGRFPSCSNIVLVFNMERELFFTMSHPGGRCGSGQGGHYRTTHLMEMGGDLCCYQASSLEELVIWIIKDYERKVWVKMNVFVNGPSNNPCDEGRGLVTVIHRSVRRIRSSYARLCSAAPIILYGALHWVLDDDAYRSLNGLDI